MPDNDLILVSIPQSKRAQLEQRAHARGFRSSREWLEQIALFLSAGEEHLTEFETLYAQGLPDAYIGAALGMTNVQVARRRERLGLPRNRFHEYHRTQSKGTK